MNPLKSYSLAGITMLCMSLASVPTQASVSFQNSYTGNVSEVFSTSSQAYAANASDSDLLHGITPVVSGWNTGNDATPQEISDGVHGANGIPVAGAWTSISGGDTATYVLDGTYDLRSIQSIASWGGGGLGQQHWSVKVRPAGSSFFQNLATINYQPLSDSELIGGSTMVTLSNLNVTAIDAIRVTTDSVESLSGFVWRELDVFGSKVSAPSPLRIMPLGDSITVGGTNPGFVEPYWYGWRSGLYNRLNAAGYDFLFVGQSTSFLTHAPAGTVPPADLAALGQNAHNGYGGQTVSYLNTYILDWLALDDPDVILLKIGTNGKDQTGLDTLVNTITTTKPEAHLIIAQIMPRYTYDQPTVDYNTWIRDTLVPGYQAEGKKVTLVDQYATFLTNPTDLTSIDQSLFSNGINHPDNDGYDKMAQVWFEGIETLGIGPGSFTDWIRRFDTGALNGWEDDPDKDGKSNGIEYFLGTDPTLGSQGLIAGEVDPAANTFTFTHPINETPATDLTAIYRWSTNLQNYYDDGSSNGSDTTVTFSQPTPSGESWSVTAYITGAVIPDKLFVKIEVTRN